jgi:diketogulonate reductase-like aldo/keto reductase
VDLSLAARIPLNNGVGMPILGLGVWQIPAGPATQKAVLYALDCGYRLIDTAKLYGNEADVGVAVRGSGVPREDVFVTTKLWNNDHGYGNAIRACEESLDRMKMDYVDLYLIHWPVRGPRVETWNALVDLHRAGKCRAIGVSNYMRGHLEELRGSPVVPAVNQIEFSPFLYQRDVREYCRQRGIVVEAYSPLTRGMKLNDRRVRVIATKYGKSSAQILLRWGLQRGLVVIPKSARPDHIRENVNVFDFEIAEEDMRALDGLSHGLHVSWDPTDAP